jgi:hypothetical protein
MAKLLGKKFPKSLFSGLAPVLPLVPSYALLLYKFFLHDTKEIPYRLSGNSLPSGIAMTLRVTCVLLVLF